MGDGVVRTSPDNTNSTDSTLYDRMVGGSNVDHIILGGKKYSALIDSGSMITCVSEKCYKSLNPKPVLMDIKDFDLKVFGAGGSKLPYLGYIEADITIPFLSDCEFCVPILVTPMTNYNRQVPVIVGTNIIRMCRDIQQTGSDSTFPDAWQSAVDSLCVNNPMVVKSANTYPVSIGPNQVKTVHGLVRKHGDLRTAVTEQGSSLQSGNLVVCPRVVSLECAPGRLKRVPVRICNLSTESITISPKSPLCNLTDVKVMDRWSPEPSSKDTESSKTEGEWWDKLGVSINRDNLTPEQLERAYQVLGKWQHIFSTSPKDLGKTDLVQHEIKLSDDVPFKEPYRRIPPGMYEEVRQHLKEMLDSDAIRESHSPYCSNVVLVRKKDGSLRFCIDLRKLNGKTIKDAYTLPRVEETMDSLIGSRYFSKLDLRSGYWQVEIKEEDKAKTAFSVGPLGFFECNRMAFGLTNAPATFQRLMQACMGESHLKECLIFLDDILIFSDTFEEHLKRLEGVFERLEKHGLKLKGSKCEFFKTHVRYLGHIVSEKGIQTDPEKLSALKTWPEPVNVKTLRSFLGFTGYYRRFIKDYAKVIKPLNDLLVGHCTHKNVKGPKKKIPWVWGGCQQKAFDTIVGLLSSPPVLAYADFTKPFIVNTDASIEGLGAVLYQNQGGHERVIAYASRGLRPSERNYPAHKLEFLCLKWALTDKFHDYLYGNTFEVRTDNNPLTYVTTTAKLDAASHRWLASLSNYNFKLVYRAGRLNGDADGLSRRPYQLEEVFPDVVRAVSCACLTTREELPLAETVVLSNTSSLEPENDIENDTLDMGNVKLSGVDWEKQQSLDKHLRRVIHFVREGVRPDKSVLRHEPEEVRQYMREWRLFELRKGVLYRNTTIDNDPIQQLVIPEAYREKVLRGVHEDVGHQGRDRTNWLAKRRFFWPGFDAEVNRWVESCGRCIRRKTPTVPKAELVNIQSSRPMELLCIDYLTLERSKGGYENVLVITDHFTRYAQAIPTRNQLASTTARVLYEQFIVHYSFPARIHSDQGRNFESKVIKELCKIAGVDKTRTTPYHPMGNGMVERFNQTLLKMLGTMEEEQKSNWKSYVAPLVHAYNATKHETTGYSPHYLMFGWHPRLSVDAFLGIDTDSETVGSRQNYAQKLKRRLDFAYKAASAESDRKGKRYKDRYDRGVREATLEVGDRVLMRNVGICGKQKLADKWAKDPYIILSIPNADMPVYKIRKESGQGPIKTVHRNLLLPFMWLPRTQGADEPRETTRNQNPGIQFDESSSSTTDSDSSDDDGSQSPRYVIPARRPRRTVAGAQRPVQPNTFGTGNSPKQGTRGVCRNSNAAGMRSVGQTQDSVPATRSRRACKPPKLYGEWLMETLVPSNSGSEVYV